MKDHLRNRFKQYPAPKPAISAEAFKKAVVSRRRAEALAHVQAQAAALERLRVTGPQALPDSGSPEVAHLLSNGHSNGDITPDSNGAEPMSIDEESTPAQVRPPISHFP